MEFKDLKIVLPTCDKYMFVIEALAYTVEKFWPDHQPIILVGYEAPKFELPDSWSFVSLGKDRGAKKWGDDMLTFFKDFDDEHFIYIEDDILLLTDVNTDKMEYMFKMMDDKTPKANIAGAHMERPERWIDLNDNEVVELKQDINYRTSRGCSIWNTKFFLSYVKPNQSPWDYESAHPKNDGLRILSTKGQPPFVWSHLFIKMGQFSTKKWWYHTHTNIGLEGEDKKYCAKILKI